MTLPADHQGPAVRPPQSHPLPLLTLKRLHPFQRDRVIHSRAQVFPSIRLHNDEATHPDVEPEVRQVEQIRASGLELDDIQRSGRGTKESGMPLGAR